MAVSPQPETTQPLAALLFDLFVQYGVRDVVIAPGSRSAPLTLAAVRHGGLRTRLVYDERSAAYTALGIAQQRGKPVCVVCSSGTAALNFAPAVAEAFYQRVPLIALTADRPPEWIDQVDNQAIRQNRLYEPHVRASFTFPVDDGNPETRWHAARIVGDAYATATTAPCGPVHINVPLREPLYRHTFPPIPVDASIRGARMIATAVRQLDAGSLGELVASWANAQRKLIVVGQHAPDAQLAVALRQLARDPSVAVIADVASNLAGEPHLTISHWEAALAATDAASVGPLLPDLAIWLGGQVTAKSIKTLLRTHPPRQFWRVDPEFPAADAFQSNTAVVPVEASAFLGQLADALTQRSGTLALHNGALHPTQPMRPESDTYAFVWREASAQAQVVLKSALDAAPFSEVQAVRAVLRSLPAGGKVQAGNSMPIRLINMLGIPEGDAPLRIDANRGTSGIDGTVSTAVGAALASAELVTLIVGDLGFFYDRNGLWQHPLPLNLRIVLLNNHGGGIFDVIDGPETLAADEREAWFLTPNPLTARRTAEEFGMGYWHAADTGSLQAHLKEFFAETTRASLLEIETNMATNSTVWRTLMTALRGRVHGAVVA